MRLVTYLNSQNQERVGIHSGPLAKGTLIDLNQALKWLQTQPNSPLLVKDSSDFDSLDMLTLIGKQSTLMPAAQQLLTLFKDGNLPQSLTVSETSVRLQSPVPRPTSMRDGYAFRQHVEAARRNRGVPMIPEFDQFPVFYFTNHLAVTGPGAIEVQKQAQEKLDFELEVAVVLGKGGKNIAASQADDYIFGYMVMNDWSARYLQMEEMKLNLGPAKGKDFATSLGPYLVTRDEIARYSVQGPQGERHDLKMKAFVNGKQVSDGNLKDMTWTFAQIIERASYGVQMYPGEVIGSGTVGTGCFLELNGSKITDNQWLKPGDQVVMEVDQLGRLENHVVDAK